MAYTLHLLRGRPAVVAGSDGDGDAVWQRWRCPSRCEVSPSAAEGVVGPVYSVGRRQAAERLRLASTQLQTERLRRAPPRFQTLLDTIIAPCTSPPSRSCGRTRASPLVEASFSGAQKRWPRACRRSSRVASHARFFSMVNVSVSISEAAANAPCSRAPAIDAHQPSPRVPNEQQPRRHRRRHLPRRVVLKRARSRAAAAAVPPQTWPRALGGLTSDEYRIKHPWIVRHAGARDPSTK